MEVIVYVEGPSDKYAMEKLLAPVMDIKMQQGVNIKFCVAPKGQNKESLLINVPIVAFNILSNDKEAYVVVVPDLQPCNLIFKHNNIQEMEGGIKERFRNKMIEKMNGDEDKRISKRFKVFCFKYELEALVLAAEEGLKSRLKLKKLVVCWTLPVEDQNNDIPPKRIVEKLFKDQGQRYIKNVDAPLILGSESYQTISERCPQCFKPFVDFLEGLPS